MLFYVFLMCSGGGNALNLVFGSYYSSSVDCEVRCVLSVTIGLVRLRFELCSFVVDFIDGLFIHGCSFYGSTTLRMSTRRLPVMLFVFSFRVTVTSCYLLRGVPVVAEEFLFPYARRRKETNCPPPAASIGSPPSLPLALI